MAFPRTMSEVEKVCPLDGTKFKAVLDFSGTRFGMQLDMKPLGPTLAPWRIPVCPTDHFAIYKDANEFTEERLMIGSRVQLYGRYMTEI